MTEQKLVAFDIEICKRIPEGTADWKTIRPLGISCGATLTSDGELRLWHGAEQPSGRLSARLSPEECRDLTAFLLEMEEQGYTAVTWNGLGFDFDVLAEECQDTRMRDLLARLALNHIDIAFAMLCEKGFMVGLDTAAKGMGLEGKTEGMRGDLAPEMWAQDRKAQEKVLEYVAQDVRTTKELYEAIREKGHLHWVSKSGRSNYWRLRQGSSLVVSDALQVPEPDTSWMRNPWQRSKFYGWTGWKA